MSSSYSAAELEAMRKEQLKKDLKQSISRLREEMMKEHTNEAAVICGTDITLSVFADDEFIDLSDPYTEVNEESFNQTPAEDADLRERLDFSSLLQDGARMRKGKLTLEIEEWIKNIDDRPVISEKDERDRARIIGEISAKMADGSCGIEDRLSYIRMRVKSYLQGGIQLTEQDKERIKEKYYEYCALCKLLHMIPRETIPYRVEKEIHRMTKVLEKRNQEEYILDVIGGIMEDLGCHIKEEAVLDHTAGILFSVDDNPMVDVFIGSETGGIMFEPVGASRPESASEKMALESSTNSICSMYSEIEDRAAEKGVILRRVYHDPASADSMCVGSDVTSHKGRRRKTKKLKERSMDQ